MKWTTAEVVDGSKATRHAIKPEDNASRVGACRVTHTRAPCTWPRLRRATHQSARVGSAHPATDASFSLPPPPPLLFHSSPDTFRTTI